MKLKMLLPTVVLITNPTFANSCLNLFSNSLNFTKAALEAPSELAQLSQSLQAHRAVTPEDFLNRAERESLLVQKYNEQIHHYEVHIANLRVALEHEKDILLEINLENEHTKAKLEKLKSRKWQLIKSLVLAPLKNLDEKLNSLEASNNLIREAQHHSDQLELQIQERIQELGKDAIATSEQIFLQETALQALKDRKQREIINIATAMAFRAQGSQVRIQNTLENEIQRFASEWVDANFELAQKIIRQESLLNSSICEASRCIQLNTEVLSRLKFIQNILNSAIEMQKEGLRQSDLFGSKYNFAWFYKRLSKQRATTIKLKTFDDFDDTEESLMGSVAGLVENKASALRLISQVSHMIKGYLTVTQGLSEKLSILSQNGVFTNTELSPSDFTALSQVLEELLNAYPEALNPQKFKSRKSLNQLTIHVLNTAAQMKILSHRIEKVRLELVRLSQVEALTQEQKRALESLLRINYKIQELK